MLPLFEYWRENCKICVIFKDRRERPAGNTIVVVFKILKVDIELLWCYLPVALAVFTGRTVISQISF